MKISVLLVAALAATGCSKKDDKNEGPAPGAKPTTDPGTPPGATTPGTTAPTPGATPGTAVGKLDCDKIFPKDLREKYLKGYTIKNAQTGADFLGKCEIEPPDQDPAEAAKGNIVYGGSLDASCHDNVKLGKTATLEALQKEFKMKPIDGIPDSLAHDAGPGWQFNVWDNDSNCSISGLLPKGVDGPALVKEWLGVFPLK